MAGGVHAPTLASETVLSLGFFDIRNTMLMAWLAMLVLFLFAFFASRTGYKQIPGRFQAFAESIIEGLHELFMGVLGDEKLTRKVFPVVATIFLFIVLANWMGVLPGVGTILIQSVHEGKEMMVPVFRSMNADVNMTLSFAIIAIVFVQVMGASALGAVHYSQKYFIAPWKDPIGSLVGLLEVIGEFSRMLSFSFRLFGNIFAGEVLLVVIGFLLPYAGPIPFLGLELFVGLIQGLVFAMLTLVFIKMAVTPHGDHEDDHGITKKELSQRVLSAG